MFKNMIILGLNGAGKCVYWIELPMIEEFRIPELISTCRQHAQFEGAVKVQINISDT